MVVPCRKQCCGMGRSRYLLHAAVLVRQVPVSQLCWYQEQKEIYPLNIHKQHPVEAPVCVMILLSGKIVRLVITSSTATILAYKLMCSCLGKIELERRWGFVWCFCSVFLEEDKLVSLGWFVFHYREISNDCVRGHSIEKLKVFSYFNCKLFKMIKFIQLQALVFPVLGPSHQWFVSNFTLLGREINAANNFSQGKNKATLWLYPCRSISFFTPYHRHPSSIPLTGPISWDTDS